MATEKSAIVPLSNGNYPTWKIQCKMALLKDDVWDIVSGAEEAPEDARQLPKFVARRDRALAIIVLAVDPSLLYLIPDPEDPCEVWNRLSEQFQKKTWANKLALKRKLNGLHLKEGGSVSAHIKEMTELFNGLTIIGERIEEEDRVVTLLASLPDSYSMLVTALEANMDNLNFDVVTERLLHEESKRNSKFGTGPSHEQALNSNIERGPPQCHFCKKFGHIRRNCAVWLKRQNERPVEPEKKLWVKHKANPLRASASKPIEYDSDSDSDEFALFSAVLSAKSNENSNNWIVDSGARNHMSHQQELFTELSELETPENVILRDGRSVKALGRGTILLDVILPGSTVKTCKLCNVLYVPKLACNLLSVPAVVANEKVVEFDSSNCYFRNKQKKLLVVGKKIGNLFYLECSSQVNRRSYAVRKSNQEETTETPESVQKESPVEEVEARKRCVKSVANAGGNKITAAHAIGTALESSDSKSGKQKLNHLDL